MTGGDVRSVECTSSVMRILIFHTYHRCGFIPTLSELRYEIRFEYDGQWTVSKTRRDS